MVLAWGKISSHSVKKQKQCSYDKIGLLIIKFERVFQLLKVFHFFRNFLPIVLFTQDRKQTTRDTKEWVRHNGGGGIYLKNGGEGSNSFQSNSTATKDA